MLCSKWQFSINFSVMIEERIVISFNVSDVSSNEVFSFPYSAFRDPSLSSVEVLRPFCDADTNSIYLMKPLPFSVHGCLAVNGVVAILGGPGSYLSLKESFRWLVASTMVVKAPMSCLSIVEFFNIERYWWRLSNCCSSIYLSRNLWWFILPWMFNFLCHRDGSLNCKECVTLLSLTVRVCSVMFRKQNGR